MTAWGHRAYLATPRQLDRNLVLGAEIVDALFAPIEKRSCEDSLSIAIAGQERIHVTDEMF